MKQSNLLFFIIPLALIAIIFYASHSTGDDESSASSLDQEVIPHFETSNLLYPNQTFSDQIFQGHVSLFVVWASWCPPCRLENPILLKISQKYHIPIYGLDYKDNADTARQFLANAGNPYTSVGEDPSGQIARKLAVYGTPESFLIDGNGVVRYISLGNLTEEEWDSKIEPLIQQYSKPR